MERAEKESGDSKPVKLGKLGKATKEKKPKAEILPTADARRVVPQITAAMRSKDTAKKDGAVKKPRVSEFILSRRKKLTILKKKIIGIMLANFSELFVHTTPINILLNIMMFSVNLLLLVKLMPSI